MYHDSLFFIVQYFAFQAGLKGKPLGTVIRAELLAYEPQALVLTGLQPGTTYAVRLLGVKRADREKCIAFVTTPHCSEPTLALGIEKSEKSILKWSIRALNHDRDSSVPALTHFEQNMYSNAAQSGYESSSALPMLTLHSSCLRIPIEKLSVMAKLLEGDRVRNSKRWTCKPTVIYMITI